jgi:hypothetical protein
LGCIKLDVGTLVSETAKNGFVDRWYKLNNTDSGKDKHKKISVQGEIRIEVEMGGILNDSSKDTSDVKADPELQPLLNDLEQLNKIQHRLITYKINLKSLYRILIDALIEMDLCVKDGQEIHMLKEDDLHWGLSKDADSILKEFANVWVISDAFRKMKLLESIFHNYKEERIHGRALLAAYKSLYEGIFKRNTVWLPNYEVSSVLLINIPDRFSNQCFWSYCLKLSAISRNKFKSSKTTSQSQPIPMLLT